MRRLALAPRFWCNWIRVAKEPDWMLFVNLQATCQSADQMGYYLGNKGPHVGQAFQPYFRGVRPESLTYFFAGAVSTRFSMLEATSTASSLRLITGEAKFSYVTSLRTPL
jgi:hypothetical protein